jgi:hypothetical protein
VGWSSSGSFALLRMTAFITTADFYCDDRLRLAQTAAPNSLRMTGFFNEDRLLRGITRFAGLLVEGFFEVEALDEHAEDVLQGEVGLLDVHGDGGGDDDVVICEIARFAAAVAGEGDGSYAGLFSLLESLEDVGRVAGSGDAEEDVAGLAEGFELAGEDLVEAEVVAAGGEDGGVGGEGNGAKGGAGVGEADDELGYEMLGVGGGASVAGDEEFVARLHRGGGEFGDGD